jgi:hypothetical protein
MELLMLLELITPERRHLPDVHTNDCLRCSLSYPLLCLTLSCACRKLFMELLSGQTVRRQTPTCWISVACSPFSLCLSHSHFLMPLNDALAGSCSWSC